MKTPLPLRGSTVPVWSLQARQALRKTVRRALKSILSGVRRKAGTRCQKGIAEEPTLTAACTAQIGAILNVSSLQSILTVGWRGKHAGAPAPQRFLGIRGANSAADILLVAACGASRSPTSSSPVAVARSVQGPQGLGSSIAS